MIRKSVCLVLAVLASPTQAISAQSWTQIALPSGALYCSALETGSVYLFAATRGSDDLPMGLYRTPVNDPGNWEFLGLAGVPLWDMVVAGLRDENVLVAASSDTAVYRSTDGGLNWLAGNQGISGNVGTTLTWNGQLPGREYAVVRLGHTENRYCSTDLGVEWRLLSEGYTQNYFTFLQAPRDASTMIYQTVYTQFWQSPVGRSTDGGIQWTTLQPIPGFGPSFDLDLSPVDPQDIYALIDGTAIYRWRGSQNLGQWGVPFYTVGLERPAWSPGSVFAAGVAQDGHLQGAVRTEDAESWTLMSDGLPSEVSPNPRDNYDWWKFHVVSAPGMPILYYSTSSLGLWMLDLNGLADTLPAGDSEPKLRISSPFPNPSPGPVEFSILGERAGDAHVDILDVEGRILRGWQPGEASRTGFSWDGRLGDGRGASSGVYFIRVTDGRKHDTVSLVLVR